MTFYPEVPKWGFSTAAGSNAFNTTSFQSRLSAVMKINLFNWTFALCASFFFSSVACADVSPLERDGPIARDYVQNLEWMRCSIGMVWEYGNCVGDIVMLSVAETHELIDRIKEHYGVNWRLPTLKELQSLVTDQQFPPRDFEPKIDHVIFPTTHAGLYWSSDQSFYAIKYQWAVNFLTGYAYNRSFTTQKNAVRLVRDYNTQ